MSKGAVSLMLILAASMFGYAAKRASDLSGLPNVVPLSRDLFLFAVFLWSFSKIRFFDEKKLISSLLAFVVLFAIYILISAFQDRHFVGVYFARIYLLPIFFFVAAYAILKDLDRAGMARVLKYVVWLNVLVLALAFALYGVVQFLPADRSVLFGPGRLPAAWFISGGTYMRMGLPLASPNNLGTYLGLSSLLFMFLAFAGESSLPRRRYLLLAGLNLIGLVATFSRSAVLMVVVGCAALIIVPAFRQGAVVARIAIFSIALTIMAAGALLVMEIVSDGAVSLWIELNWSVRDPSLLGHWHSFVTAYEDFEKYYLLGYPRGTVGPRAFLFLDGIRFNIENSLLGVIYDLGLVGATVFCFAYVLLLSVGYRGRLQIPVLMGFLLNTQFLPYIFEPDIISFFLFIYLLIGNLIRLGYLTAGPRPAKQDRQSERLLYPGRLAPS